MTYQPHNPPTSFGHEHAAALADIRTAAAPIGSHWRHRGTGEVWRVMAHRLDAVILKIPGTTRHKCGLVAHLLGTHDREHLL